MNTIQNYKIDAESESEAVVAWAIDVAKESAVAPVSEKDMDLVMFLCA